MNNLTFAMHYGQGNPGALEAAMELIKPENLIFSIPIVTRLESCSSIKGTNFYVLWSDLCGKDLDKMSRLCSSDISNEVLENACNRQDYSGRELVKDYF